MIVLLGGAALVLLYGIALYNGLVARQTQVETEWSQIDVQLKRRSDLVPNLVEVVKDYMGYEQETLTAVVEARAKAAEARDATGGADIVAEGLLGAALRRLFALAEDYPELKADASVRDLQGELNQIESQIAQARDAYNEAVRRLNVMVDSFPSNLIAGAFGFAKAVFFDIAPAERAPVKVDLR